jgi:hypothetical protein
MKRGSEVHLFIVWSNAMKKKDFILNDISEFFTVVNQVYIRWNEKDFTKNLQNFYRISYDIAATKKQHCGTGDFLAIIVEDNNPVYELRDTLNKKGELVNVNIFDKKNAYRALFEQPDIIHGTNDLDESFRDLTALFGRTGFNYYNKFTVEKTDEVFFNLQPQKLNTGKRLNDLFSQLNEGNINYVVIRNWDNLPDNIGYGEHFDLDILTDEPEKIIQRWLLEKVQKHDESRAQYKLFFLDESNGPTYGYVDLRTTQDNYFPENISNEVLQEKVRFKNFYTPSKSHHFLTLLYHALYHKSYITNDYKEKLMAANIQDFNYQLLFNSEYVKEYLTSKNVAFVKPVDATVTSWEPNNFAFDLNRKMISYRLLDNDGERDFFSKVFIESNGCIVKESTTVIGKREMEFLKILSGNKYFPKLIEFIPSNETFVTVKMEKINGLLFSETKIYDKFNTHKKIITLLEHFINMLIVLAKKEVIHRDIHLKNIIIDDNDVPNLIDFGWSVNFNEKNVYTPYGLGAEYRPYDGTDLFSDSYSVGKMFENYFGFVKEIRPVLTGLKKIHYDKNYPYNAESVLNGCLKQLNLVQVNFYQKALLKIKIWLFENKDSRLSKSILFVINGSLKRAILERAKQTLK